MKNINKQKLFYIEIVLFVALILFAVCLRLASLDYVDGSDNYNDVAYKSLYQNGSSCYKYSTITSAFTMSLIDIYGFHIFLLKMPSILYSLITLIFIYFIVRRISKVPAFISVLLFAISPWSIALSRVTRDYAFDCMVGAVVLYLVDKTISKEKLKNQKDLIYKASTILLIIIALFLFSLLNHRRQTLIAIIFPAAGLIVLLLEFFRRRNYNKKVVIALSLIIGLISIALTYFISYGNFPKGYTWNWYSYEIFFNPKVKSPWQWFHGTNLPGFSIMYFMFFLFPIFYVYKNKKEHSNQSLLFYLSFFIGIFIFMFKFVTHLNYIPTRYLYFLFPCYVIIVSFSIYYFVRYSVKNRIFKTALAVALTLLALKLTNIGAVVYAIYPELAYKEKGTGTLTIDNIGIGRFDMNEVVNYLKSELGWNNEQVYVFGGRYGEFILLLDYQIDPTRCLNRDTGKLYDVGNNMFVESSYFNYHELEYAIEINTDGYFVTQDHFINDKMKNNILKLNDNDFILYGATFKFIQNINQFRIYYWSNK